MCIVNCDKAPRFLNDPIFRQFATQKETFETEMTNKYSTTEVNIKTITLTCWHCRTNICRHFRH